MHPIVIVTGDFVKTGGMDRANYALADYISRQTYLKDPISHAHGKHLDLVGYRFAPELRDNPSITCHAVAKPGNSYFFGSFLLNSRGREIARQITNLGGRVVVNGGNCQWSDVNWVHYVHAAYLPTAKTGFLRQIKSQLDRNFALETERKSLQSANLIIANSNRTRQDLIERLNISSEKIYTCYCGTDPKVFYPATPGEKQRLRQDLGWDLNRPIVLFIGALGDRRKGFDTLFTAWKKLCQNLDWDADLIVIGRGAELALWQARVDAANLSNRIRFLGFRTDVPDLMRAADCLVAPTRYEAYGLGVHEAICCGLPAITSASAGIAERYPLELTNLLLKDPEDTSEMVQRLINWRFNDAKHEDNINQFSQDLRQYSWDTMAEKILGLIASS